MAEPASLVVRHARRRDGSPCDLVVAGGRIAAVEPPGAAAAPTGTGATELDAGGGLVLPAFVNVHLHLDKTRLGDRLPPDRTGTMQDGARATLPLKARYTIEDIHRRATEVLDAAVVHGAGFVRGLADVDPIGGLTGVDALLRLRDRYADRLHLQVAAFTQEALFRHEGTLDLLTEAVARGVDVVAGCPQLERNAELVRRHVEACFELAVAHGLDLHFLADDTDDPASRSLEVIADCTAGAGWEGRVIVGHVGALAAYDHAHSVEVIRRVRDAGVTVCTNPQISLTLMGREDRGLVRRGTTRINELRAAGVRVIAAQDDVDDPYYPFGIPSQLEVAKYTAHVAHLTHPAGLEAVVDMVTTEAAAAVQ
ncbi:MAG TPA: amidohydrolase family protein, partial [Acidimicrobiales bacterium]